MNKHTAALVIALASLTAASDATAQYVDRDDSARFEEDYEQDEFMINARGHALVIPGFMLDWIWSEHANHWSNGKSNFAWGGEFTWRRNGEYEIGLAVDWADLRMTPDWWQDNDDPPAGADWTTQELQLVSIQFFTRWFWDINEWFSPFVGVGLGPGILLGKVTKYNPSPGSECRSQLDAGTFPPPCSADGVDLDSGFDAGNEETTIPPVVPVVAFGGGARFNIAKYGMLKIELGFQDYFYAGLGAGVQW